MEKRLSYIDAIKGFAILLMVMGHVLANMFADWQIILQNQDLCRLWHVIYLFHMPLFMFVAGYLGGLKPCKNLVDYFSMLCRRAQTLLIPFFASGILLHYCIGRPFSIYWFLVTLFALQCILGLIDLLLRRLPMGIRRIVMEIVLVVITYAAILVAYKLFHGNWYANYILIRLRSNFWFFAVGRLVRQFGESLDNPITSYVCVGGLLCIVVSGRIHSLIPWLTIGLVFCFFKSWSYCETSKLRNMFEWLGRYSLEIYIIHLFYPVKLPVVGLITQRIVSYGAGGGLFALHFIYSLAMSALVIVACFLTARVLELCPIFYRIFLGRKVVRNNQCE